MKLLNWEFKFHGIGKHLQASRRRLQSWTDTLWSCHLTEIRGAASRSARLGGGREVIISSRNGVALPALEMEKGLGQDSASPQPKETALLTYFFRRDFEPPFLTAFPAVALSARELGVPGARHRGRCLLRNGRWSAEPESAALQWKRTGRRELHPGFLASSAWGAS